VFRAEPTQSSFYPQLPLLVGLQYALEMLRQGMTIPRASVTARFGAHVRWISRSSRRSRSCCYISPLSASLASQHQELRRPSKSSSASPPQRLVTTKIMRNYSSPTHLVEEVLSEKSIQNFIERTTSSNDTSLVVIEKDLSDRNRGWALHAKQDISKGVRVFRGKALKTNYDRDNIYEENTFTSNNKNDQTSCGRGSHTIQTGWNQHVVMDLPAILVNHCCQANVGIRTNNVGAYDFIALRDIKKGQEVLWDYETSEYYLYGQFLCSCGAPNCRGTVKGFHAHGQTVTDLYGKDYIAPYLFQDPKERVQ
jgi:hypothetical protein